MKIRKANINDLPTLKLLWYECFLEHDSKPSIDYYFENNFDLNNTFVLEINNEIVTSLQMNQHQLMIDNKVENVSFVVGVATFKIHRKKGYMKKLLEYTIDYVKNNYHQSYIILQAYNWDVYRPFGFIEAYYKKRIVLELDDLKDYKDVTIIKVDSKDLLNIYNAYTSNLNGFKIRDIKYYDNYLKALNIEKNKIISSKNAYLAYQINENVVNVFECAYKTELDLLCLIRKVFIDNKVDKLLLDVDLYALDNFDANKYLYMMVKNLNDIKLENLNSLYISEEV